MTMGVVSYLLNYGVFKHYATLNAYDVNLDQVDCNFNFKFKLRGRPRVSESCVERVWCVCIICVF